MSTDPIDNAVSRRAFLANCGKLIGSAALASIILPVLQGCEPTSMPFVNGSNVIDVSDLTEANPAKQAIGLRGIEDGRGIIITRIKENEFAALSRECTHQGCNVEPTAEEGALPCFCHGSQYALDGTVLRGPAASPLKRYNVSFNAVNKLLTIELS